MGLEINSTGIQQLTPAEKLRTAERGWKNNSAGIQQLSTAGIQKQETFKYYHAAIH